MQEPRELTVGVLFNSHVYTGMYPNKFVSTVIRGMQAAAHDRGINLLVACGMSHGTLPVQFHPAWPEFQPDTDFLPIGPWNTDGLLIFSPLHSAGRIQYIRRLQEDRFPMVFIGGGAGFPSITVDNEGGIRQVMEHLVGHGHRNIAFIAGDPEDPGDSRARIEAYRSGVREFGLNDDPRLLEYGLHWDEEAFHATRRIMQSGVPFSAVMCSNDQSALGVMRALIGSGLRVPHDVAVTGFDDQPEALTLIPPLTTIHYPLFETGYRALILIRKRIEEGPDDLPDTIRVFTRLVTRQSCGCMPEMNDSVATIYEAAVTADPSDPRRYREDLAQAMMDALIEQGAPADIPNTKSLCGRLIDAFLQSVQDGDLSHFQIAMIEILQRLELTEEDAHAWQAAVSILRLYTRILPADAGGPKNARLAEDLLHQARLLLSDSARRRFSRLLLQQTVHDEAMGRLTSRLLSSLDEEQVYATLAESLPQLGIRSCRVIFFEPQDGDPFAGSILTPRGKDFPGLRFESRKFPPPELYSGREPFCLAVLPLFFHREMLGYVAFDGENLEPLAMIVIQLAAAIKSAQLHAKVLELSLGDSLTGVYNRRYFEILLPKEVNRCRRYGRDLAVIIADIDRFKDYIDAFGRLAGDDALREITRCVLNHARRGLDVITRYGGEEFAVILPETDARGAWEVAEAIRQDVAEDGCFLRKTTVSLGIAALHGDELSPQLLVEQADRALYQAKSRGRNRAVRFEPRMPESAPSAASGIRSTNGA